MTPEQKKDAALLLALDIEKQVKAAELVMVCILVVPETGEMVRSSTSLKGARNASNRGQIALTFLDYLKKLESLP